MVPIPHLLDFIKDWSKPSFPCQLNCLSTKTTTYLPIHLSVYQQHTITCLSAYLPTSLPNYKPTYFVFSSVCGVVCLPIYLAVCQSVSLPILFCLSACPLDYQFVCQPVCLTAIISICLSTWLSVSLSAYLFTWSSVYLRRSTHTHLLQLIFLNKPTSSS